MNDFYFDELVLGGSLTALLYAYKKNLPILIDIAHIPFVLEEVPSQWDLSFLGFNKGGDHKKSQVWDRLSFLLSMSGLIIFPNNIQSFRLENNKIHIIGLDNKKMTVNYEKLIEFDRDSKDYLMVYDWYAVHSGSRHDWEVIPNPDEDLCHLLLFHRSTRPRTRSDVKDVCAVSRVPREYLNNIEWSPTYTRIRTLQMMKEVGIRGRANGYNNKGKTLHYAISIEHMFREVFEEQNNELTIEEILSWEDKKGNKFMEFDTKTTNGAPYHLAGIVPCGGQPLDYGMEWPDFMMPVAPNYTMIEAAIMECAWAGCETIWVCLYEDTAPLVRHRIGDWLQDPVWAWRSMDPQPTAKQRRIPIFYVPVHPKNRFRRDCLAWSVIEGALSAFKVSATISKWVYPNKYWVSFPYGLFNPELLREHRQKISSPKNFYVTHNGQTVEQGIHTSFSFGKDEFVKFRRQIRKATGEYTDELNEEGIPKTKLPIEERFSARWFDLQNVFIDLDNQKDNSIEIQQFYDLSSWHKYKNYLSSPFSETIERPPEWLMKFSEFGSISLDRTD